MFPDGRYENWGRYQELFPHAELALGYRPVNKEFTKKWAIILFNAAWYTREYGK